jgi:transcriptional regulator with XRE-family HTH domain
MAEQRQRNGRLEWLMRRRGITQEKLAAMILSSRAHVSEVLANKPRHGRLTRPKLAGLREIDSGAWTLTDEMLQELGWDRAGRLLAAGSTENVPVVGGVA